MTGRQGDTRVDSECENRFYHLNLRFPSVSARRGRRNGTLDSNSRKTCPLPTWSGRAGAAFPRRISSTCREIAF